MDGIVLKQEIKDAELLLGCWVQSDLKWGTQIANLKSKLAKRLACLAKLQHSCPYSLRKIIAEGVFNSLLLYCLPLYGGLDKKHIIEVQTLQNKAARLVCRAPPRSERSMLYDRLGWLTYNQLIAYHTVLMIKRVRMSREPKYLSDILMRDSRNGRIMMQNTTLTITAQSFCFRGSTGWNALPVDLREDENLHSFKKRLRYWIIENVPRFID